MYNDVIYLIKQQKTDSPEGDMVLTETSRMVFAETASIGMKEFYQASAAGLQPEIKFILPDVYEYDGEKVLEFNDERYRVLRTYQTGTELELTCTRGIDE